ncbi:hypothetical protein KM043_006751 [Ampulex compressa]|nr:hypothetical protein KM043_006751 [Ampulex compressa]
MRQQQQMPDSEVPTRRAERCSEELELGTNLHEASNNRRIREKTRAGGCSPRDSTGMNGVYLDSTAMMTSRSAPASPASTAMCFSGFQSSRAVHGIDQERRLGSSWLTRRQEGARDGKKERRFLDAHPSRASRCTEAPRGDRA